MFQQNWVEVLKGHPWTRSVLTVALPFSGFLLWGSPLGWQGGCRESLGPILAPGKKTYVTV